MIVILNATGLSLFNPFKYVAVAASEENVSFAAACSKCNSTKFNRANSEQHNNRNTRSYNTGAQNNSRNNTANNNTGAQHNNRNTTTNNNNNITTNNLGDPGDPGDHD